MKQMYHQYISLILSHRFFFKKSIEKNFEVERNKKILKAQSINAQNGE